MAFLPPQWISSPESAGPSYDQPAAPFLPPEVDVVSGVRSAITTRLDSFTVTKPRRPGELRCRKEPHSAADDHLERLCLGCLAEGLIRLQHLVKSEGMSSESFGVELVLGEKLEQHR